MALLRRLANLFHRTRVSQDIDAELAAHLALRTEDNLAQGKPPAEAERAARLRFGNRTVIREQVVAADAALPLDGIARDLRYALRQLSRSPQFTATAVVTLMLGIAANVVVFGVLNAVLLHPLDVSDPQSLYQLRHKAWTSGKLLTTSYPAFQDLARRNTSFSGLAAINAYSTAALRVGSDAVRSVSGDEVTSNYFDLLGVQPQAGRLFHAADEHGPGSAPFVVLSDTLWRNAFHADRAVVGTTVELNRHPFTVIGVSSAHFHGTEQFSWPDYWLPMVNEQQVAGYDYLQSRTSVAVTVIGRLKPHVTPQQATEDLNTIAAQLAKECPQTDDGQPLRLIHPGLLGDEGDVIRGFLVGVTVLALLVFAAACANLATLFAARAADRSKELAVRTALGASKWRLLRQLLSEAAMISTMGGTAGILCAYLLLGLLNRFAPFAGTLTVAVDGRVYLVGALLTLASALLFALLPAQQVWQRNPSSVMRGGTADALHVRRFAARDVLLGTQIAICTLLVTASLVAVRGMVRELQTPLGFQPQGAMLADIDMSQLEQSAESATAKQKAMLDAIRSMPGVVAAGTVSRTPMTGGIHGVPVYRPGTTEFKLSNAVLAPYVFTVSPGYFQTAGTRLLSGRDVSWHDTAATPHVAVVNRTLARTMWGGAPAIGQRFLLTGNLTEVVGVAEDGKYHDLQESPQPALYVPLPQTQESEAVFVVRSHMAPNELATALGRTLGGIEPDMPVTVQSWPDTLASELFPARAAAVALGIMGLLAAMLTVTGIFGMAAYSVSRRMKELGIRVALGARRSQVVNAAVGRPLILLGMGLATGLVAGIGASSLLRQIVYKADPGDPLVLGGAVLMMALLGIAASALPARRALAVDPSRLMREE